MRSVYLDSTKLSFNDTLQGQFFRHCNTFFLGERCPDCREEFTEMQLVVTKENALRLWDYEHVHGKPPSAAEMLEAAEKVVTHRIEPEEDGEPVAIVAVVEPTEPALDPVPVPEEESPVVASPAPVVTPKKNKKQKVAEVQE